MNTTPTLTADEASRLAVTATAADLEDWARDAAFEGRVELDALIDVLAVLRADSIPDVPASDLHVLAS
jgi:hypothetical protein